MSQTTQRRNEAETAPDGSTKSEYDWLFEADRCRIALLFLEDATMPVELDTLAEAVATEAFEGEEVDEATTADVARTLHRRHLPKMGRLGVITYDHAANKVISYL